MKIKSKDVWQADTLDNVLKAVNSVADGGHTYDDIARAIGMVERQGRYYRRAAEILGFINRPRNNYSVLTPLGRSFINANENQKKVLIAQAVLSTRLIQRVIPFLESKGQQGASRQELTRFLSEVADLGGETMAPRRIVSIIDWLDKIGSAKLAGDRVVLTGLPEDISIVKYADDEEPLFPTRYELEEYEDRNREFRARREAITVLVDDAKRERAVQGHQMLVNLVARRLRAINAIPKANRYIDLSAHVGGENFLFEMKSSTEENIHNQLRRGLSQLYEYRYLQRIDRCKLVLVLENPIPRPLRWIEKYLLDDRGIFLVWDGRGHLECSGEVVNDLPFIL